MWKKIKKIFEKPITQEKNIISLIQSTTLFRYLTKEEILTIIPHLYVRNYVKNEVVYFRTDPSKALYIIKKGTVAMKIDVNEHLLEVMQIKDGQLFGENTILKNAKRLLSAVVVSENAEIYAIPYLKLQEVFQRHGSIKIKVINAFAEKYNERISQTIHIFEKKKIDISDIASIFEI
ncbi:MAG: cyclic nucleotide-binding domain-containing protein [Chitinophagaceae bacterium]|nr:cyclic nucleotide-binding domain-containing protein [Chitinophagaceae bacterium]